MSQDKPAFKDELEKEPEEGSAEGAKGHRCPQCKTPSDAPSLMASEDDDLVYCRRCKLPLITVAGKYRIEKKLGEGGGGIVYLARHTFLPINSLRVIKFIHPQLFENAVARKRFVREILVTSALSAANQHIVRIYDDFGTLSELGYFYVMEYLNGEDLGMLLERNQLFSLPHVWTIVNQLCDAIHAAHEVGVIHRDLKPANVFLMQNSSTPFVKVMDFGLAKQVKGERLTLTSNKTLGTPLYMAPEQFMGNHNVDHRADIYAIGSILYELLVGHMPFLPPDKVGSMSLLELVHIKFGQDKPTYNTDDEKRFVSPELQEVVNKSLAQSPEERYPSVSALREALARHEAFFLERKEDGLANRAKTETSEKPPFRPPHKTTDSIPELRAIQESILKVQANRTRITPNLDTLEEEALVTFPLRPSGGEPQESPDLQKTSNEVPMIGPFPDVSSDTLFDEPSVPYDDIAQIMISQPTTAVVETGSSTALTAPDVPAVMIEPHAYVADHSSPSSPDFSAIPMGNEPEIKLGIIPMSGPRDTFREPIKLPTQFHQDSKPASTPPVASPRTQSIAYPSTPLPKATAPARATDRATRAALSASKESMPPVTAAAQSPVFASSEHLSRVSQPAAQPIDIDTPISEPEAPWPLSTLVLGFLLLLFSAIFLYFLINR